MPCIRAFNEKFTQYLQQRIDILIYLCKQVLQTVMRVFTDAVISKHPFIHGNNLKKVSIIAFRLIIT